MSTEIVKSESLWAISDDIRALFDTLDGMVEDDPNYVAAYSEVQEKIHQRIRKVSGVHGHRVQLMQRRAAADAMQSLFLAARLECDKEIERLDEYVTYVMEVDGVKELAGSDGLKIKLRNNPPSVVIIDEAQIPFEYRETVQPPPVEKIVKAKIAKALKSGVDVPGADLNISSTRVDWGDPAKPKKAGAPAVDWKGEAHAEIE
jgi:hypothetical protein